MGVRASVRRTALVALALCGAAIFSAAPAAAADGAPLWTVDYAKSRLGFSATQTGATFVGSFQKYTARIAFDPEAPETALVEVTVDMSSARTGDRQRDAALPSSDWFKVKAFPTATYVAKSAERRPDGTYALKGTLTMRGVSRPLDLPFTLTVENGRAKARGEASLVRTDWGVGEGEFADGTWVGLDVKIAVEIEASR